MTTSSDTLQDDVPPGYTRMKPYGARYHAADRVGRTAGRLGEARVEMIRTRDR